LKIKVWDDRKIDIGYTWYPEITKAMEQAVVSVCLISPDFLASAFCVKEEVPFLLKKQEQAGMLLLPILLRPCLWKAFPWLKRMQMIPTDGQSVTKHYKDDYDDVFLEVTEMIYEKLQDPSFTLKPLPSKTLPPEKCDLSRMPMTGAEVFGRSKELEQLDAAWESKQIHVISFVAWGGVGKTTLINRWLENMKADNFKAAQRVYAWSFYSQGNGERVTSADQFIFSALEWFGDPDPTQGSPWDKGKRLAVLIQKQPTLLILDGLEPLQSGQDFEKGQIKDPSLDIMIKGLMRKSEKDASQSLCIITTRVEFPVADRYAEYFQQLDLELISKAAGRALLRVQGIRGTDEQLENASQEFGNHALALNLLGAYLRDIRGHHINHIKDIPDIDVSLEKGFHARKIMNAFDLRWGDSSETNLLHILGLFDRPADQVAIDAVIGHDIISGLTDQLPDKTSADWPLMLEKLRKARMLAPKSEHHKDTIDCHPLVREHFGENLHQTNPRAWQQAHERLYNYYKNVPKQLPDTLDDMSPLFSALTHGCLAGKHQEVLDDIFWKRIRRKDDGFVVHQLGAFSSDLASVSCFFEIPWHQLVGSLREDVKPYVLNWAGFSLRALGRLQDALKPMRIALEESIKKENWKLASINAGNLSEFFLILGKLDIAVDYARKSVSLSDNSNNDFVREYELTTLADALHHSGEFTEANKLFREAENMQRKSEPEYNFLYSLLGFRFCNFLLSQGRYEDVIERAKYCIDIAERNNWLLHIALGTLSLGSAYLLQAIEQNSSNFKQAEKYLNNAVEGLRKAGTQHELPRGLLYRTALYRAQKNFIQAWEDLYETIEICEQGNMQLFMVDSHIEACNLLQAEINCSNKNYLVLKERFNIHMQKSKEMIKKISNGHRNIFFEKKIKLL